MVDSYESDDSDVDLTETNVLLGFTSADAGSDSITRLGGRPEWLDVASPPSAALARCQSCGQIMSLLLQVNGELPDRFPDNERRIYVFSCRQPRCWRKEGCIRALRGVRVFPATENPSAGEVAAKATPGPVTEGPPEASLGETLFGVKHMAFLSGNPSALSAHPATNPFSAKPMLSPSTTQPARETEVQEEAKIAALPKSFAQALKIDASPGPKGPHGPPAVTEPWPAESEQPAPFRVLYLGESEYEALEPTPALPVLASYVMEPEEAGTEEAGGVATADVGPAVDTEFQKFALRLAQNPEQAIRYEYGGTPLLCSRTDTVGRTLDRSGMPRCESCGAVRVFEVQLMPHAITELEDAEGGSGLEGMEWCTIVVGVCSADCQPAGAGVEEAGYITEWTGVQWEEVVAWQ